MKLHIHNSKKKSHGLAVFLHRIGRDAYLDWALSVMFSVAVTIVLIGIGAFIYVSTRQESSDDKIPAKPAVIFDEAALGRVISDFDRRAAETAEIKRGYSGPGDPSQ